VVDLVARDIERDAAIRSVRFATGTVIAGEAGVGKTSLAGSVADVLAERGVPVVRVLATAAGRSIPFAALGPLLPADLRDFQPALVPGMVMRSLADLSAASTRTASHWSSHCCWWTTPNCWTTIRRRHC
jgi:hypothetical protein